MTSASSGIRVTVTILLVFALAAGVLAAAITWATGGLLARRNTDQLLAETRELSEIAARDGIDELRAVLQRRLAGSDAHLYGLSAVGAPVWLGGLRNWPENLKRDNATSLFSFTASGKRTPTDAGAGPDRLAVGVTLRLPDGGRLLVGRDVTSQQALMRTIRNWFLGALAAVTVLSLLAGWAINRALMARLDRMSATARRIMAGDLSRRIPVTPANDEFDALAGDLNAMLDRIERLMSGLREVSDNIAHDLKTPLSRLRIRAEGALRDARGDVACREGLEQVLAEADDLMRTFNALLQVARLEAGTHGADVERFDLAAMIADIAELYAPVIEEAGARLVVEGDRNVEIRANRQLISQALTNLIENGLKYGLDQASDKTVAIGAVSSGDAVAFWVGDHGKGIKPADRERVLKRFVRLDEARTRPGTGIGLSLVAAVAAQHGGSVELCDNDPGLKVVVRLQANAGADRVLTEAEPSRTVGSARPAREIDDSQPSTVKT